MGIYIPGVKLPPDKKYKWDLVLHITHGPYAFMGDGCDGDFENCGRFEVDE